MDCSWLQVQSGVWWHESCRLVDLQISDYPLEKINNQKYKFQGDTEDNHDIPRGIVWDEDFTPNIDEVDDDGSTSKFGRALIVALGAAFFAIISFGAWLFCKRGDFLSGKPWEMWFLIHCIWPLISYCLFQGFQLSGTTELSAWSFKDEAHS